MVRPVFLLGMLILVGCGDEPPPQPRPSSAQMNEFYDNLAKEALARKKPPAKMPPPWTEEDVREMVRKAPRTDGPATDVESGAETMRKYHDAMRETEQERRIELLELEQHKADHAARP